MRSMHDIFATAEFSVFPDAEFTKVVPFSRYLLLFGALDVSPVCHAVIHTKTRETLGKIRYVDR